MINLITKTDILGLRQISKNVPDKIIDPYIKDAQFIDVQKLLGSDFFNDLLRNSTDENYIDLLTEGDYVYNGTTYTNVGLKAVLVYYSYARYILLGSNIDTPFGFVTKDTDVSSPSDLSTRKTISKENEQIAFNYWENVKHFLDRNKQDYPLWNENCSSFKRGIFRISKIG